ncbi:MAG: hypothetical protein V3U78_04635 [Thiotrichaceae bacterium]
MAVVNLNGSFVMTPLASDLKELGPPGTGGGAVRSWIETVEAGAADTATSTYLMARLPSNARILGNSRIYTDILTTTAATIDIGVFNLSGKSVITDDEDALNDGLAVVAAVDTAVVKDIADYGKRLWEYVASQTEDPLGDLDIKLTLLDANIDIGGTITIELYYTLD